MTDAPEDLAQLRRTATERMAFVLARGATAQDSRHSATNIVVAIEQPEDDDEPVGVFVSMTQFPPGNRPERRRYRLELVPDFIEDSTPVGMLEAEHGPLICLHWHCACLPKPDAETLIPRTVVVQEGWWHPNTKSGQVHDHPESPNGSWSVAHHRLCEPVYTRRRGG